MNCLGFGGLACQPPFRRREVGGEAAKAHRQLTVSLINAVLGPPPWDKLAELQLLNPYNEQITMDDKLSILDIKARDDRGRLFNVQMQMVSSASPRRRLGDRMPTSWMQTHCQDLSHDQPLCQACVSVWRGFGQRRVLRASTAGDPGSTGVSGGGRFSVYRHRCSRERCAG
jgi:hypothetical protein